jgi:hypothetical protein
MGGGQRQGRSVTVEIMDRKRRLSEEGVETPETPCHLMADGRCLEELERLERGLSEDGTEAPCHLMADGRCLVGVICPYAHMPICHCHRITYDIKDMSLSFYLYSLCQGPNLDF